MADNPTQPAPINESEARGLFKQAAMETGAVMTIEDFEAFKRYLERQASQFLPCTKSSKGDSQWRNNLMNEPTELSQILASSDSECRHCIVLAVSELMLNNGTMRVDGHSPALAFREMDLLISELCIN
jgi:hypothetical protein